MLILAFDNPPEASVHSSTCWRIHVSPVNVFLSTFLCKCSCRDMSTSGKRKKYPYSFIHLFYHVFQSMYLSLSLSSPAFPTMCASDRHRKFASPTAKFVGTHSRCCVWRRNLHIHDLPLEIHTPGSHDQTTRNGELCFWALRTTHPSSRWETAWNPVCRVERVGLNITHLLTIEFSAFTLNPRNIFPFTHPFFIIVSGLYLWPFLHSPTQIHTFFPP